MDDDLKQVRGLVVEAGGDPDPHHLTRVDLRDDRLHGPAVIQTLEVYEQEPARQLYFHDRSDKLGRRLSRDVLKVIQGQLEVVVRRGKGSRTLASSSKTFFFSVSSSRASC